MNISRIIPYENNPRINDNAVDAVAASIKEFGFKVPIIVDKNNVIVAGHTRLKAAQKLGLEEVPVIVADDLSEEQVKAFRLADNKVSELADWDFQKLEEELAGLELDMSQFNFDMKELSAEFDKHKDIVEDDFNLEAELESIIEPVCQMGDVYQLGDHRLLCGDSTDKAEVERLLQGKCADLVVTDPPYNVDYEGQTKDKLKIENDKMSPADFKQFLIKAFTRLNEVLKEGGAFYIWLASREQVNFETALNEAGLKVRQQLIWNKSSMVLGRQDYQWKHEPCLYGWKDGASHNWYSDRSQTTVMDFAKPNRNGEHPTMKPLDLIGYQIKNSSTENEIVLDQFGGSGSTLIACEQLKRSCYTMELDPKYCDVIIKRWETMTGKKAIKIVN